MEPVESASKIDLHSPSDISAKVPERNENDIREDDKNDSDDDDLNVHNEESNTHEHDSDEDTSQEDEDSSHKEIDESDDDLMSELLLGRGAALDLNINHGSIDSLVDWIKSGKCENVVVLSGAGISCAANIPDFRTPGTGLYDNLQRFNLPFPQAVFDLNFYRCNPQPFVSLASEIWPGEIAPTLTHSFVKLLHDKGLLLRNYTQNIDGLEVLAGVPTEKLVECHGHFRTAKCIDCRAPFPSLAAMHTIVREQKVPKCNNCGGYVKPDIVFFGEGLPSQMFQMLRKDLFQVDLMIVMGTSLTVAPVSHIPSSIPSNVKRVLINRERVGDFCIDEWDDVFLSGDCDKSVSTICEKLGWKKDLDAIYEATRIQSKSENDANSESDENMNNISNENDKI